MADVKVTSNAAQVAALVRDAAGSVRDTVAAELAEAKVEFDMELRGPSPGGGLAPVRTLNLLQSGTHRIDGLNYVYKNNAKPYRPSNAQIGDEKRLIRGSDSYASFAHRSRQPEGQFAVDAQEAFDKHFGSELERKTEAALKAALNVG